MAAPLSCSNDESLGPAVTGCRGNFDFTVTFELIFLSIVPSVFFIAVFVARGVFLALHTRVVRAGAFQYAKLALISVYAVLALVRIALDAAHHAPISRPLSLASASLVFAAGVCMLPLSFLEHQRSPRPSIVLAGYLALTLLFDIVQTRTLWLSWTEGSGRSLAGPIVLSLLLGAKVLILLAESVEKPRWLLPRGGKSAGREEVSGIFNLGVFYWLNALFLRGYSGVMTVDSLYSLDPAMSSEVLHGLLAAELARTEPGRPWRLRWALARALAWPLFLPVLPRLAYIGFAFSQPFFISTLIRHLQASDMDSQAWANKGKGLIGASVLIYVGTGISKSLSRYYVQRSMYMARGCLASVIYHKTTAVPISTAADDDGMAPVTLMSTDVERIVRGFVDMHEVWANIVEIALGCWLLQTKLGLAFLSPVVVIVLCFAIMAWVGIVTGKVQAAWMDRIQARVGMTAMAISQLKQLKIAGLDSIIRQRILALRLEDLGVGGRFRFIQALSAVVAYAPQCLSPIFAFALGGRGLGVEAMYTSLSFLVLLTTPLATFFQSIPVLLAGLTCLDRIDDFLSTDSRSDPRFLSEKPGPCLSGSGASGRTLAGDSSTVDGVHYELSSLRRASSDVSEPRWTQRSIVSVSGGDFGWNPDRMTLTGVNFEVYEGQLVMIAGPVASGKSTICKAILGEVPFCHGRTQVNPPVFRVALCDQNPYIMAGTIRDNITHFTPFDQRRYNEAIHATALEKDFATFSEGDHTRLESGGLSLSGGQRQRLALARALYQNCLLFVVDDALSGLDSHTDSLVFQRCFGPHGIVRRRRATVVLSTHSARHLRHADHVIMLGDDGRISGQGSFQHLSRAGKIVKGNAPDLVDVTGPEGLSVEADNDVSGPYRSHDATAPPPQAAEDSIDEQSRQQGDIQVYKSYLSSISWTSLILLLVYGVTFGFGLNFPTLWIGLWSEDTFHRGFPFYIGIYALTRTFQLLAVLTSAVLVMVVMVRASGVELHRNTLDAVLRAPLAVQMAMNVGKVTNLFSQDMTILDSELPISFLNCAVGIFGMIGMAIVMAVPAPWLALSYPALFALLWLLQKFYLRTSRQLRLLDLETKTPLYAHFLDTIQGAATIRAYSWTNDEITCNYALLDTSQRPAYLLAMAQQWLILTLDLVVAVMALMVTTLATQLRTNSSFTGASLVTLMSFGELVAGIVRSYTQLETSIGAVSRLRSFSTSVPREEDVSDENWSPDDSWPHSGNVEMRNIYAAYSTLPDSGELDKSALVLRGVNLSISAGQKVAVCGRTGSGKSSLILVLLRLLDPIDASRFKPNMRSSFTIDGVPAAAIRRDTVRQRLIAVPQDCVFLPEGSSIKDNLDISGTFSDEECLAVLEAVHLASFAADHGGLQGIMSPNQLSAGQKQLFSMARTILRRRACDRNSLGQGGSMRHLETGAGGGMLILDEVSSSVDDETEVLMHKLIQEHFASYTVIMVAHRLDALSGYADKIIVMDRGEVVEMGQPSELLERADGWFRKLLNPL